MQNVVSIGARNKTQRKPKESESESESESELDLLPGRFFWCIRQFNVTSQQQNKLNANKTN